MKKIVIILWIFLSATQLMAGGNINPNLSVVANIPYKMCKENKVYIEKDTQLMWQDQTYTDAEDGAYKRHHSVVKAGTWTHAVNYCRKLNYTGYTDWRLPTADELMHVHRKQGQVFTYYRGNDFWSSTPTTENRYYVIFPADAYQYKRYQKETNYIRCVRCIRKSEKVLGSRLKTVLKEKETHFFRSR
jgi:hypothetical protein